MVSLREKSAAGDPVIEAHHLSKAFAILQRGDVWRLIVGRDSRGDRHRAVDDVSLSVPKGEFVGVLGRNGAGKSTLLRTIGGVFGRTAGVVRLGGSASGIYELGVGAIGLLTGRQYAERWLVLMVEKPNQVAALIEDAREFSELQDYFDKPMRAYSAGMRARLSFAVATAPIAEIYLIDEVLSVGDERFQSKCWARIRKRIGEGASGLFASHDWTAILKLCRTACLLEGGQIRLAGPSRDVVWRYLDLTPPRGNVARFSPKIPGVYYGRSGEATTLAIPIDLQQAVPLVFAASVESFGEDHGWDHLLHLEKVELNASIGPNVVELTVPQLPLAAGRYSLNVFLAPPGQSEIIYDTRSWTYGNDLALVVDGPRRAGSVVLPFQWSSRRIAL